MAKELERELVLKKALLDQVVDHCRQEYPDEACGILAGNGRDISMLYRMTNTDESSTTFFMDSREQFAVVRDMRARGLEMVAIYHSHPHSPAYPSSRDIELAFYPEALYIIISLLDIHEPDIRTFWIKDREVSEELLEIEKGRGV